MFIGIGVLFALVALATVALALAKHRVEVPGELFRLRETGMTVLLGLLLWLEAGVLLWVAIKVPERLLTSSNALINTCVFLVLSILLGAGMLLYGSVKCTVATQEGLVAVDLLGRTTTLAWQDIQSLQRASGKRLTVAGAGVKITLGGNRDTFKEFVSLASGKIPPQAGDDVLRELKQSLKIL